jgi:hypothetical protein
MDIITQNEDLSFSFSKKTKGWNKDYSEFLISTINKLYPLFHKAKSANEFEYILSIIGYKETQTPGWDTFENTIDIFEAIGNLKKKTKWL